jgi:hypothetical protein
MTKLIKYFSVWIIGIPLYCIPMRGCQTQSLGKFVQILYTYKLVRGLKNNSINQKWDIYT